MFTTITSMKSGRKDSNPLETEAGQKQDNANTAMITKIARVMDFITGMEIKKMSWSATMKNCSMNLAANEIPGQKKGF
jgi:hypothetical protein